MDFVFSDGDGKYDNGGGKDYHSPVAAEDGSTTEIDHVAEREAALEAQYGAHDEAGLTSHLTVLLRRGATDRGVVANVSS